MKNIIKTFLFSVLLLAYTNIFAQENITSSQAKDFVGKEVILTGKVAGSKLTELKTGGYILLLNIDKPYPQNEITIMISKDLVNNPTFKDVSFLNKTIQAKGKIILFKEKPEIIIEKEENFSVKE